uniref:Mitochondrial carrier protein n=1 Tax=Panagrolaimus sp. PS1159 TaxID=55785 RepID=A0AC35FFG0_9BILA
AVGHPFDTVKVRLQTMPKPSQGEKPLFNGALDCFQQTIKREGFFALYKGMTVPAIISTPRFAIFFGGCAVARWLQQKEPAQEFSFIQTFNTGALAGIFTTILTIPGERIKCILQIQSMASDSANAAVKYNGPKDLFAKLYKEGGICSIYRGASATLIRGMFFIFAGFC